MPTLFSRLATFALLVTLSAAASTASAQTQIGGNLYGGSRPASAPPPGPAPGAAPATAYGAPVPVGPSEQESFLVAGAIVLGIGYASTVALGLGLCTRCGDGGVLPVIPLVGGLVAGLVGTSNDRDERELLPVGGILSFGMQFTGFMLLVLSTGANSTPGSASLFEEDGLRLALTPSAPGADVAGASLTFTF